MKLKALAAIAAGLIVSVPAYGGQYENLTDLSLECESAILVDVDALDAFGVDVAGDVGTLLDNEDAFARTFCFMRKGRTV